MINAQNLHLLQLLIATNGGRMEKRSFNPLAELI